MEKRKKLLLAIILAGFSLNFVWEVSQAPLYQGYVSFQVNTPRCTLAAVGDAFFILITYLLFAIFLRNFFWIGKLTWKVVVSLLLFGGAVATGIEIWAVSTGHFAYKNTMPLVPVLGIGLSPFLQFILTPLLAYYIGYYIALTPEERNSLEQADK